MNIEPELAVKIAFWVGLVAGLLVGLAFGAWALWYGERIYRQKLETWIQLGAPARLPATVERPAPDAEDLARAVGREGLYSDETIARGVEDLMELAKEAGRPLSREEAREQVLAALHPDAPGEGLQT